MSELLQALMHSVQTIGNSLIPYYSNVEPIVKDDGSWLTVADRQAHETLLEALPQLLDLPVLSEETEDSEQQRIIRESGAGYWCVDPLDGTSNFTQGIPHWCVSVGLVLNGEIKLGVVYDPNRQEMFSAEDDLPARLNQQIITTNPSEQLSEATAIIDFKRLSASMSGGLILKPPYRSQRNFGASALDICWVAANRCQVYLHGEQKLWDYLAAKKILHNTGGRSETFSGDRVFQNDLMPKTIIAASSQTLFKQWRRYIQELNTYEIDAP